jgi:hypothetical protein
VRVHHLSLLVALSGCAQQPAEQSAPVPAAAVAAPSSELSYLRRFELLAGPSRLMEGTVSSETPSILQLNTKDGGKQIGRLDIQKAACPDSSSCPEQFVATGSLEDAEGKLVRCAINLNMQQTGRFANPTQVGLCQDPQRRSYELRLFPQ